MSPSKPKVPLIPQLEPGTDEETTKFAIDFTERDKFVAHKAAGEETPANSAMLRRTMSIIEKIWDIQPHIAKTKKDKQTGFCPDNVWEACIECEQLINQECEQIKLDAQSCKDGWGEKIFDQAAQLAGLARRKKQQLQMEAEAERQRLKEEKKAEAQRAHIEEQNKEMQMAQSKKAEAAARHAELIQKQAEEKKLRDADLLFASLCDEEDKKVTKKSSGASSAVKQKVSGPNKKEVKGKVEDMD